MKLWGWKKNVGGLFGKGQLYDGIKDFVSDLVKEFLVKGSAVRSKISTIEFERMKYHKNKTEKGKLQHAR